MDYQRNVMKLTGYRNSRSLHPRQDLDLADVVIDSSNDSDDRERVHRLHSTGTMSQIHGYHPYDSYQPPQPQPGQAQQLPPAAGQQYYPGSTNGNAYAPGSYPQPGMSGYMSAPPQGYNVALNGPVPLVGTADVKPNYTNPSTKQQSAANGGGVGKWSGPTPTAAAAGSAASLPPVKNACISCRTRKARCDGVQPICGQCASRSRECVFVKSRRGGKRIRKAAVEAVEAAATPSPLSTFLQKLDGLLLPPDQGWTAMHGAHAYEADVSEASVDHTRILRQLDGSTRQILTMHYDEVHGFLPVLPHRRHFEDVLANMPPKSPLLLAIKAILLLVPNDLDPSPNSKISKKIRATASMASAKQAYDLVDSLTATLEAGDEYDDATAASLKLDMVQALVVLCLWEWGQTADLVKNKAAANRAMQLAMDMGLHQIDKGRRRHPDASRSQSPASAGRRNSMHSSASSWDMPLTNGRALEGADWRIDMKRRTWWIAYMGQMTSAIVGATRPVIGPDDPRVMTDYPITTLNDNAWPNWIETVKICSRCIDLIISLDYPQMLASASSPNSTPSHEERRRIKRDLVMMDRSVVEWMKQAEMSSIIELVPGAEEEVVRNQQLSARLGCAVMHIQIHKRQAFPEVSLFSKKICGFPKAKVISALRGDGPSARLSPATSSLLAQSPHRDSSPSSSSPLGGRSSNLASSYNPSPVLAAQPSMYGGMDAKTLGFDYNMLNDPAPVDFVFPVGQNSADMSAMMDGLLWDSTSYPSTLPQPWFAQPKGAAGLWLPTEIPPGYDTTPVFDSSLLDMSFFYNNAANGPSALMPTGSQDPAWAQQQLQDLSLGQPQQTQAFSTDPTFVPPPHSSQAPAASSTGSTSQYNASTVTTISTGRQPVTRVAPTQPHKAWGVDIASEQQQQQPNASFDGRMEEEDDDDDGDIFPPGVSLARCATAAHTVVRLEVLHRSASMALWKGPPKWLPFCACGLVAGAYSFLLLALAVQAENTFSPRSISKSEEIRALLTNVKVILAGLEAYGTMWDGIGIMAAEVRAALEAASTLPDDVVAAERLQQ